MELIIVGLGGIAGLIVVVLVVLRLSGSRAAKPAATGAIEGGASGQRSRPAASLGMKLNWLEGVEGSVKGKTYHIGSREATIGRKVGNYIQVMDDTVSRVHLRVEGNAQGIEVTDQKSNIGTKVNGVALVADVAHQLKHGDRLELGQSAFVFHSQADFKTNHGLTEAKVAGQAQQRQTAVMGALNWKQEVADALMKAGGDKAKAAEIMGVPPEVFEKMLEQAQQ